MDSKEYSSLFEAQRGFFAAGGIAGYDARRKALLALASGLRDREEALLEALRLDLRKSRFEAYTNELAVLHAEIAHALSHLRAWMRPRRVLPELQLLPSMGEIRAQALGCSLIIAPWNYPIQLALAPLVAALAAGCTAVIKPSELSSHAEKVLAAMIGEIFDPRLVLVVTGGPEVTTELLRLPFDKIFFTGSPAVGKIVMRAAAEQLASV
ncbi:MAG TPA: aldehyde dehydrogenase family protein, partial [Rectinemataceae bacterium]|nr:aldehyde dehydrogenase family protein [Rectinemataceae bacterium]